MTDDDRFDVVIVGAGIAGAILAKRLSQEGKSVLVLEAGAGDGFDPDTYARYVTGFYGALAKVPNSPYPENPNAPSASVIDIADIGHRVTEAGGYLVQKGPLSFASDYLRAAGGTTLHWLGTTLRLLPNDFRIRTLYGQGVDWPIAYEDLRPYYEMAEREIGVAGDTQDQTFPGIDAAYFGEGYVFPMTKLPRSYLDQQLIEALDGTAVRADDGVVDLAFATTPQGRNSHPNPAYRPSYEPAGAVGNPQAGQRCEGNASCVPICPVQAKYSALKTLSQIATSRARVVTQAVASRIEFDSDTGRVTGLRYKRYASVDSPVHEERVARGTVYAIAGNAIETAKLMLASGGARSSPDLGRHLMDHPVMLSWGLMPAPVGAFRGPGSTSHIASFRDGRFRGRHAAFIMPIDNWGWGWPAFSPGSDVVNALDRQIFGRRLREAIAATVPRQVTLHCEFEQLPDPGNRVTIDPAYLDRLGDYRPVIEYDVHDYTRAAMAEARRVVRQIFAKAGVQEFTAYDPGDPGYVTYEHEGFAFRGAGHLIGTHRMGTAPANSVVDRTQRAWEHDNLYLVGAGSMVTTGTCNPTLTVAALSVQAADSILKRLA